MDKLKVKSYKQLFEANMNRNKQTRNKTGSYFI